MRLTGNTIKGFERHGCGRRGGVGVYFLLIVLIVGAVGAGAYFYQQIRQNAYAEETASVAREISESLERLNERSPAEAGNRLRERMKVYLARSDADPRAEAGWTRTLEVWDARRTEREAIFADMLDRAGSFPPSSSLAEVERFEKELQTKGASLNPEERTRLKAIWEPRKRAVMASIGSVSATLLVRTIPSGAKTYLNGEYMGLSSLGIQKVRGGSHSLVLEKEGYAREEREVAVTQSGQIQLDPIELKLLSAVVRIAISGGGSREEITVSLEKSSAEDEDTLLYFESKEGRDVVFENAPVGIVSVAVMAGSRMAIDQELVIESGRENRFELSID